MTALGEAQAATVKVFDDYVDACTALDDAQAFLDRNEDHMDDGPRATAMAALVTARFAKVSAGLLLIRSGVIL